MSSTEQAIAELPSRALTEPTGTSASTFHLLQAAVDKGMEPDALEKLVALQERIMDREAEQSFNLAMVACQEEIAPVVKSSMNNQTKSRYAKLSVVKEAVSPIALKHGFALMVGTADAPNPNDIRVTLDIRHERGHHQLMHLDLPRDDKGMAGKTNKTALHGVGSTMSYGERYLICTAFNVQQVDQDDDGNRGRATHINETEIGKLRELFTAAGMDKTTPIAEKATRDFLAFMGVDALEEIRGVDYSKATNGLCSKIKRMKAEADKPPTDDLPPYDPIPGLDR